jgi:IMP dehydrogenase
MKNIIKRGLTFDDVLLVPKKSSIYSRKDVSLKTKLTKNIVLNSPIISSNMDTVTESKMAIAMARKGGIGIIHRFMSIEDQMNEVLKVKRAESIFLDNPYTLEKNNTVKEALFLMKDKEVSGILIVDSKGKLDGILTSRDVRFEENINRKISEIMTKNSELISSEYGINLEEAKKILHKYRIEKLPIVDNKGYLIGLITSSDIKKREKFPNACKDKKGRLRVGAAIGVKSDFLDRTEKLIQAGCDTIVVDIAHGHSDLAINAVKRIKNRFEIEIIAGNVATAKGTQDLIDAGSDAIKVGIGGGSICITRIVSGAGVPQLSAIMDCATVSRKRKIPLIADGGIRNSGDITKALAAGASTVMLGNILAGTEESPGITISRDNGKYKVIRGMASFGASLGRKNRENGKDISKDKEFENITPEGVEALVQYKGNVSEILDNLTRGIQSGFSYSGARNMRELYLNSEFIHITTNSINESKSHDVKNI